MGSFRSGRSSLCNPSEAELAPVLKANFSGPVIQITRPTRSWSIGTNAVDNGFGRESRTNLRQLSALEANLHRAGNRARQHRSRSRHGHLGDYRRPGDEKSARWRFRRLSSSLSIRSEILDRQPVRSRRLNSSPMPDPFKKGTIAAAPNLPPVAERSRFVRRGGEITSGVHYVASPGDSPCHPQSCSASGDRAIRLHG